ncbi:rod shape-determining protein MreC [Prevotella copri]|jgi:putative cell shape-determining protein mreC|uniref:Cell shape-determining protein MreC n=1 Tax=Segatella copri TaxID=165179 RepID=A0A6A7WA62_9BACT|nr:rod shape-determining protein MreC [Segatella copri]MBV3413959.1 rod shape-determining protein MreC [Segatella copri]MEE0993360.1 rod shape-determining protein MreC [Prevotella sp.]MQP11393.1 rod shape-determining protein MreC [Segatella copri]
MHNLTEFLAKHNHWFVFLVLEVVSMVLLFRYNSYQGSVWFSSANAVTGKVYEWDSAVESFFSLSGVNSQLTQRNAFLEQQVRMLDDSIARLTRSQEAAVTRLSSMVPFQGCRLIPAKVVANMVNRYDNLITIDKGSADGVKRDMGVVCGMGVVGIVYLVSEHYSIVIPALNSHSNISCTIQRRGYFGYLRWRGGSSQLAYLEDVPRHAHFKLGDNVVTSGYSSVFPPGVMVGKVLHVFNSADGLSYRVQVKLSTDFARLRDVCLVDDSALQERIDLMRAAQDSIKPQ